MAEQAISTTPYEQPARLFKALMHPARLAILDLLRNGEHCVCHIEAHLGYRQAYISQQLMALREAGLVEDRRDGLNIFYHVAKPEIFAIIDAALEAEETPGLPAMRSSQAAPFKTCPCPQCNPCNENIRC
jgi:ArsR family transcriptional regulator